MTGPFAVSVRDLSHAYGDRRALDHVSLDVLPGQIFALLGPNGGGKTTLFRVVATLVPPQQGDVFVIGHDVRRSPSVVRQTLGVVFQAPSLDKKLTVLENLRHQAALYGVWGRALRDRQHQLLTQFGLDDRSDSLVETLSGGLRRRLELAKAMIHQPQLLVMDEPTTGLDPGVRAELWRYLVRLRDQTGITILLTTHLLDEAERADRIAILDRGKLVAADTPDVLKASVGGDWITIQTDSPDHLAGEIESRFGLAASLVDREVRVHSSDGHQLVTRLVEAFSDRIQAIRLSKPTLEDVFINRTGHRFWYERSNS